MKYYITHSCGHEEMVELFGKGSERERKIAQMESRECAECRARHATERDEARGYAVLDGSPKQVAWASDIREGMLNRVASEVAAKVRAYDMDWSRGKMPEAMGDESYFSAQILDSIILDVLSGIEGESSAKWFIDNKDASFSELGGYYTKTTYDEMVARYTA